MTEHESGSMRRLGPACVLLAAAVLTVSCSARPAWLTSGTAGSTASTAGAVAVPSYRPPAGAPRYCTELAHTTALPQVATALGALAADGQDAAARQTLARATAELRGVSADASGGAAAGVRSAADGLAASLARAQPPTAAQLHTISAQLAALGSQVQAACGFPS